ncbi:MAG: hypothetical protein H6633_21205 [Anaerolineales bacterium]|nr:hypothetical protein [Anaerolineales bacterium]
MMKQRLYTLLTKKSLSKIIAILFLFLLIAPPLAAQTPDPSPPPPSEPTAEPGTLPIGFHLGQGDSTHMAAARRAGGTFAVVVFSWADIEPEPNYLYWEKPDAALRAAEFYGLDLIARLDQPPDWALDATSPTPWKLDAYAAFARRVAERYGDRLAGVAIWNEPNLNQEWHDQPPDAAAYAAMLQAAYPAIKAAAPDLPVLLGALASTEGEGDWAINDLDYLQSLYAAGAKPYFDIYTAHAYGFGRPPDDAPEKFRPNFRRLELLHDIMIANGDGGKPIWVTEMGWLTWTDNPKHDWQVVTPELQAQYTLQAIDYAQAHYPWLHRLGIWQLNTEGDSYGYGIWTGPNDLTPTYQALLDTCPTHSPLCRLDPTQSPNPPLSIINYQLSILAPDVAIRLGDRSTLYPHWVHLYRGGRNFSPDWQGDFFLTADQSVQPYDLLLETMQIDQAANRLIINGTEIGYLQARPRPDPTSTWVTQRFTLPPDLLKPGVNTISIAVGPRNPARQYLGGRWENMEFRHIRLVLPTPAPPSILSDWQPQPSPSGWSETNRLRRGPGSELWLLGLRPGEVWQVIPAVEPAPDTKPASEGQAFKPLEDATPGNSRSLASPPELTLENRAGDRPDLVFNDLLSLPSGQLAATQRGLFWRSGDTWQPVNGAPGDYAYIVVKANQYLYAGFENEGLWSAPTPIGPWQRAELDVAPITDLVTARYTLPDRSSPVDRLYVTTDAEIFVNDGLDTDWRPLPLPTLTDEEMDEAGESNSDKFKPRLFVTETGELLVRSQDRLWRQGDLGWALFGPDKLAGKLFSVVNCCRPGQTIVGSNDAGLWQLTASGDWTRLDADDFFSTTDATELVQMDDTLYAAGDLGLFYSRDGGHTWRKVDGLPATITDLMIDPDDPAIRIAATPAGLYRSRDAGRTWEPVSPPWTVWDLALGPQGRLFAGRSNGLVWSDDLSAATIVWHAAEDMEKVYFLSVNPHPVETDVVWTGTWGNNIGVSSDGGRHLAPLHNGLETLSGLDLIWHPTPGQVTLATFEGLYRTDDGGQSWFKLPGPLAHQTVYSLLQTDDGAIWAGAADGLWRSPDYGVTWARIESLPPAALIHLGRLAVPPPSPPLRPPFVFQPTEAKVYLPHEWLWAGTEGAGLWLSQDNGDTWQFAGLPRRTVYTVMFDPLRPDRLVAATDRGIFAVEVAQD